VLVVALVAAYSLAYGDEAEEPDEVIFVPVKCLQYWSIPAGAPETVSWNAVLSFAACMQDGGVYEIDDTEDLAAFVEHLQAGLEPALYFYAAAIQQAPPAIKLRATYYVALGQVTLMTRARASIVDPELRDQLEPLLDPHAKLAYLLFSSIIRLATEDSGLVADRVGKHMVASSHALVAQLRKRWSTPVDAEAPLLAVPR
jgi:hypothetical protein